MKRLLIACLFLQIGMGTGFAQTGLAISQLQHCDSLVQNFLNTYNIPSASLAISKAGKLIYMKGFGYADLNQTDSTYPHNLFRIASISKPITAIAIMKMVENGQLNLSDTVFGTTGLLANHSYLNTANVTDNRIYNITVKHLLEHSGGWDRDIPCISGNATPYNFQPSHCDPIGFPRHVTQVLGEPNPVKEEMHIKFLMEKGLDHDPGSGYWYSNIGYLVLGEIIEEISGMSYEDYVKTSILAPLDICDMHVGKSLLEDKMDREMEYEGNGFTVLSAYGGNQPVPWEYGGWVLEAMSAHGGWIATARDLVRLLNGVDGFASRPDILNSTTIDTMTSASVNNQFYAKGWQVNNFNNWWHTGSLDGTSTIMVRSSGGYNWAFLLNKRILNSNTFWSDLDNLPWACISGLGATGVTDFSARPTAGSSNITVNLGLADTGIYRQCNISWIPGNGDKRLLVVRDTFQPSSYPIDGISYNADSKQGHGDDLGNGNYVLYNGSANNTTVELYAGVYFLELYEYNKNAISGQEELYNLCLVKSATISVPSPGFSLDDGKLITSISPNPVLNMLFIELQNQFTGELHIQNLSGQSLKKIELSRQNSIPVDVTDLVPGLYLLTASDGHNSSTIRFIKQ